MRPNLDVFLFFFNAVLSVALAVGVVVAILRREYLPVIRRLEAAESANSGSAAPTVPGGAPEDGE